MQNKKLTFFFFVFIFLGAKITFAQKIENFDLSANKLIYGNDQIEAIENVILSNKDKKISSDNLIYFKSINTIKLFGNITFTDTKNNKITSNFFEYNLDTKEIFAKDNISFEDKYKNIYNFKEIKSDDNLSKIEGTEVKIALFFEKDKFKNNFNPKLTAKKIIYENEISTLFDASFSTCKENNNEKNCPNWKLNSDQIIHNKLKKTLTYKNTVLDLNEVSIIYLPYFSHPDPTIKRESGFLPPKFSSLGNDLGSTIKIPYFFNLSKSSDFTFAPVYYFKNNPLFLGEYREKFKNGDVSLDFSYTEGYKKINNNNTSGSRNHFYGQYFEEYKNFILDESSLDLKIQHVNNRTYLRVNKINSIDDKFKRNLVKDNDTILTNEISINSFSNKENISIKSASYKNLTRNTDQFDYLTPNIEYYNYDIIKNNYYKIDWVSAFRQQNTNTNQNKSVFTNNLFLETNEIESPIDGLKYKYLGQIQNFNYNSDYNDPKKNQNIELNSVIAMDTYLPMTKNTDLSLQTFTPRFFGRYSPGQMTSSQRNETSITSDNIFSLNRLNTNELIEKNLSLTAGFDWSLLGKQNYKNQKAKLSLGQVFKMNDNQDLPRSSSLNNKSSDIVSSLYYEETNNLQMNIKNTFDNNNPDKIYYTDINLKKIFDKDFIGIQFYEKTKHVGNKRNLNLEAEKNLEDFLRVKLNFDRNMKNNQSDNKKISFEYENECIKYLISLNKNNYSNNDVRPETTLFFGFTLVPFGEGLSSSF